MAEEAKDKHRIRISDLLKSHPEGLPISEVMKFTDLARHTVLARLHHLIGKGVVEVRQVNMAKLHYWKGPIAEEGPIELTRLKEEHITKIPPKPKEEIKIDFEKIKGEIEEQLKAGKIEKHEAQIIEQRTPIAQLAETGKERAARVTEYVNTGIAGLDTLFDKGIPKGSSVIVAGGAGSGKTIFCLQIAAYHASQGKKVLYMSFEESEDHLLQHMDDFGWDDRLIKKGNLIIKRFNPFEITRSVDALLMRSKGELLIDVDPVIFPENFSPDIIIVDSLTAIASAFTGKEDSYRVYIEQLFRLFEKMKTTSFLITETKQIPTIFSPTGVEEFLADGVIVFYNIKRGNVRENAIEVLKLRGAKHQKKIVAMQITDKGIVVYPEQEVFSSIEERE